MRLVLISLVTVNFLRSEIALPGKRAKRTERVSLTTMEALISILISLVLLLHSSLSTAGKEQNPNPNPNHAVAITNGSLPRNGTDRRESWTTNSEGSMLDNLRTDLL